jgi:hypothetical protein
VSVLGRWLLRGFVAALFLLVSEILLWNRPGERELLDWLLLVVAYLALAALILDLALRYRIHDLFSLLALAGFYSLLNGLLINPQSALADVPRTWVTRVLGAHTLLGLGVLLLLIRPRYLLPAGAVVGLLWGIWLRWLPSLSNIVNEAVPLPLMLMTAALLLAIVLTLWWLAARDAPLLDEAQLRPAEWGLLLVVLVVLIVLRMEFIDTISLLVLPVLMGYCLLLLWFQRRESGATLFDHRLRFDPQSLPAAGLLLLAAALGYSLALGEAISPVLAGVFAAFGLVWLPTASLVLGVRAYRKLGRQRRL